MSLGETDVPAVLLSWLARNSLQACLLIGLILAVQVVLRGRLRPRWRHGLWLILVARLALPWTPPSAVSLYNLLPAVALPVAHAPLEVIPAAVAVAPATDVPAAELSAPATAEPAVPAAGPQPAAPAAAEPAIPAATPRPVDQPALPAPAPRLEWGQVLHWFNPLVWYAFARMRIDRELACDGPACIRGPLPALPCPL